MEMNANKVTEVNNTEIGAIGGIEKFVRAAIGFSGLLAVIIGVASTPSQYFALSALGIYLIHTVIIGLDPFYTAAHYLRGAITPRAENLPFQPQGHRCS